MTGARVDIPRRAEIEQMIADGVSNGAIAASLQVPHADVARVRKILREADRKRQQRASGGIPAPSPDAAERKRARDRAPQRDRGKRHDLRGAALAEESRYRKIAVMRRARVLEMLAEGETPAAIAAELDVGLTTVTEIIARLEGRRGWRRQVTLSVQVDRETRARIARRLGRGEVSSWAAGLIVAELDRLDREGSTPAATAPARPARPPEP